MLDTRFPRPLGDIGHPDSFGVPVRHALVRGAWPSEVVTGAAALRASGLLEAFAREARDLERQGAAAITTSCGFLVLLQRELQDAVSVPVVTSSLLQLPNLLAREPQVGVLTISAQYLGAEHLLAAALALQARAPGLRTVVLECTNMPPYAQAVREATGFELRSLLDATPLLLRP